jgi:hypothetical protein
MAIYTCFARSWWKYERDSSGKKKKVPHLGRRTQLATFTTAEAARNYCTNWNNSNDPGPLSRKAEFTANY